MLLVHFKLTLTEILLLLMWHFLSLSHCQFLSRDLTLPRDLAKSPCAVRRERPGKGRILMLESLASAEGSGCSFHSNSAHCAKQ